MQIGLGSDEIGFECKQRLRATVSGHGHAIEAVSTPDSSRSDIYSLVDRLASGIYAGRFERAVLVCASAIGASVLANRQPGVRAALCHDLYSARHGVQDDDMNFLVMGACAVTRDMACELTAAFIETSFIPQERGLGIPKRRLARVVEQIRNNLDKPLAVSALSGMAEMSQSHFSKLFKLSTGLAPHQFALQERINRAKALLRQGNETIADIALGVGFENQAHFTTVFGNLVGMTPRQFQNSSDELIGMYRPFLETAQCS